MRVFTALLGILLTAFAGSAQTPGILQIKVLEGDGAINDIRNRRGHVVTVEVRDENFQVVENAEVTFTAPLLGPSGLYPNGTQTMTVTTDSKGVARSAMLVPNPMEGRYQLAIRARQGNREGMSVTTQSNTLAGSVQGSGHKKLWVILGVVGGGVAAGIAVAGRGSGASGPSATTITLGGVSVGAPR